MAHTNIPRICIDISDSPFLSSQPAADSHLHHRLPDPLSIPSPIAAYFQSSQTLNSSSPAPLKSSGSLLSSSSSEETSVSYPQYSRIPPSAIVSLVNLLDAFDADVELQVTHVKENIKELQSLMDLCKAERAEKVKRMRQKQEQVERDTKGVDSDFWTWI